MYTGVEEEEEEENDFLLSAAKERFQGPALFERGCLMKTSSGEETLVCSS
jgi:hypothetical protein